MEDKDAKRVIMLVADSLRLGGAILGQYPDMLAPQLVGRLLSEMSTNRNIRFKFKRILPKIHEMYVQVR